MAKTELSKEVKLKIIKSAKNRYIERGKWGGLCTNLIWNENRFPTNTCHRIGRYIPEFSITNAKRLAVKYNFPKPDGVSIGYWWNRYNSTGKEARIAFMDALINEIENND